MFKVIANEREFISWIESREQKYVKTVIISTGAIAYLRAQLQIMDSCYGEERNIEKDLGGYMIIFFDKDDEVQKEYNQILRYHHLKENEFEYEEYYNTSSEKSEKKSVKVRLYLCSSDYAIINVNIC